ncbi:MAG: carbamoyl-phosphate synthase (glutamine-hydrolyzing) large subunit [Nitrososphaerota archaeon]
MERISKVLVLGSGGIKIAEAAEFDYSGSQALKALKEEGIKTVLVNPNVATIQTSHTLADKVYLLPLTSDFVSRVIEKERPDGILIGFGGQSALSTGVELYRKGVLSEYSVKVLGTPIEGIEAALTRHIFRETMLQSGIPIPPSMPATTIDGALEAAEEIGYPVIVRVSFNLGGRGSFIARRRQDLESELSRAFSHSPVKSLLVERYLDRWKEIEYEIVRDRDGNSVAVACLENIEPMGVHTGESLVVAPSQTLTDTEYQSMRRASIKVAEAINLIGECNVQLALDQKSGMYYVIETNPRMSRSSALASKATGYPLAYVAAKLALGYLLDELINKVTGTTTAFFEPSLDYIVLKAPRWDLEKFWPVENVLNSEMKSVGEVMAIGRNLEEVYQKAFRMLDIGVTGVVTSKMFEDEEALDSILLRIENFRPYWLLDIAKAIIRGATVEDISSKTGVDPFFIRPVENIVKIGRRLINLKKLDEKQRRLILREAVKNGFSAEQIAELSKYTTNEIMTMLNECSIFPVAKNIDTLAGEQPARTNYLYMTFNGIEDDTNPSGKDSIIILGAGGFRIGVSVEFDWAVVGIYKSLRDKGWNVIVINYNPETVSTDWDIVHRLYNAELATSSLMWIMEKENTRRVIISAGGQIGNNLAVELAKNNLEIIGTPSLSIDRAEDRSKFSRVVEDLGLKQPPWNRVNNLVDALDFADEVGYPVIVRPSYILSGSSIFIAWNKKELSSLIEKVISISDKPIVISKYFEDAIESEVDGVTDGASTLIVPLEHVEPAGVHSGDATIHTPLRELDERMLRKMTETAHYLVKELKIKGPFNVQFIVKNSDLYVLEMNLRCSRSMPFSSKACGINLMDLWASVITTSKLNIPKNAIEIRSNVFIPNTNAWAVKSPQFSWAQLKRSYPFLSPEMRSTGEVAALGLTFHEALLKSWISATPNKIPSSDKPILIYTANTRDAHIMEMAARKFMEADFEVVTLSGGIIDRLDALTVEDAVHAIKRNTIGLIITSGYSPSIDYAVRRTAVDHNVPLILDAKLGYEIVTAIKKHKTGEIEMDVKEISEYWNNHV